MTTPRGDPVAVPAPATWHHHCENFIINLPASTSGKRKKSRRIIFFVSLHHADQVACTRNSADTCDMGEALLVMGLCTDSGADRNDFVLSDITGFGAFIWARL
ncbi:hypothetical protein KC19_8G038400 [Ceratodon purpureus]|uniref:Uncharacterized protein n=1 Tax=Ceratodon purpureus TaxID=3225 RepID=A0A8T0H0F3_CERPU|nr:hypothetical protein KC19_8G038400 [Ceratodon purpureus]